jgi:hypothetical protein
LQSLFLSSLSPSPSVCVLSLISNCLSLSFNYLFLLCFHFFLYIL